MSNLNDKVKACSQRTRYVCHRGGARGACPSAPWGAAGGACAASGTAHLSS